MTTPGQDFAGSYDHCQVALSLVIRKLPAEPNNNVVFHRVRITAIVRASLCEGEDDDAVGLATFGGE
jgi:hypothetical protein